MKRIRIQWSALVLIVLGVALLATLSSCGGKSNESHGDTAWSIAEPWSGPSPQPPTLFPVRDDRKWGYIDKTGALVIDYQFDGAEAFSEGMAVIRMGGKQGYIDESGSIVIPPRYAHAASFSCGLAWVDATSNDGSVGTYYVDQAGNPVIYPEAEWHSTSQFSEGLAGVRFVNDDYTESRGYMDTTGKLVIWLPDSESCHEFSEGLAAIDDGYIDRSGQLVVKGAFLYPTAFSDGLAVVDAPSGWAIIDRSGAVVTDLDFLPASILQVARGLHEGRAAVSGDDGWGYVDGTGEMVIPEQFCLALDFSGGLAYVEDSNDKMAYIDLDGNYVWREK